VEGDGRGPLDDCSLSDRIIKLARKAGVKLCMHALRRGFGCRYAGRVPAQVLQRLMRHASIKTTMDSYTNGDEAVKAAVLGPKRNRLRSTPPLGEAAADVAPGATPEPGTDSGE
jgi:integrase